MKLTYPAIFYNHVDEGCFTVEVPDLPGCTSWGETLADAILMGVDAASGWVLDELEDGKPAPKASAMGDIHPSESNGFVSMLVLDMDSYAEKHSKKAVRKSLTIPAWLNTYAEERHISYSKVLRESLTEMYERENQVAYG